MTMHDLLPRGFSLLREEHVSLFYLGHDIGMPLNFIVMNTLAPIISLT
jgi:hypothetical protein